ncbi:MAG: DNA-binding response regulator [Syntrophobacteraceae bacterium CG2_30_61_12]|nr:MAG: DNA-binding response regulator [Syntrophobacteraceae bacterium CG2_30_61_12]PIU31378.1 MAG: DNA-binding response regulator [Syntrophobacteraceae bacterium CG07_land_8_20_14_0_80_61_8]
MEQKRIFIAEDHTILREGLRALLSSQPDLQVIGEAADGLEAIRAVDQLAPDLVLMDLSMPRMNGLEAIAEIKRRCPSTKVLVLTVHRTEEYVLATFRAGANGYVLKDAGSDELEMAIRHVLAGSSYLSPKISDQVIAGYLAVKEADAPRSSWDLLTQREREVLKLVAEGRKNKEIADFLCISPKTVERHRANLMKKLDLHSAAELTAYALQRGIILH